VVSTFDREDGSGRRLGKLEKKGSGKAMVGKKKMRNHERKVGSGRVPLNVFS
jgi:hypothetical protein